MMKGPPLSLRASIAFTSWLVVTACGAEPDHDTTSTTTQALEPFVTSQNAGALAGSLDVSPVGTAGYTIPIEVPAWRGGVQPSLTLRYSSDVGNGWLGVGWTLDGLSQISRCGQTFARDGEPRSVSFTTSDKLCLDGERLVPIDGTSLADTTTYRTSPDAFLRVTVTARHADLTPSAFQVRLKNGQIRAYGGDPEHRLEAQFRIVNPDGSFNSYGSQRTHAWLMASEEDRSGNRFTVTYAKLPAGKVPSQIEYVPWKINYGNRTIELGFCGDGSTPDTPCTPRSDSMERWAGGTQTWITRRLSRISISAPETAGSTTVKVFRRYELAYTTSPATKRSLLAEVSICDGPPGTSTCMRPTKFAYSGVAPGFEPSQTVTSAGFSNFEAAKGGVHVMDVNGDGFEDVVYRTTAPARWFVRFGSRTPPWLGSPVEQPNLPACSDCVARPVEVNGDGFSDLMVETITIDQNSVPAVQPRFYLGSASGFGPASATYDLPPLPQPAQSSDPDAAIRIAHLDPMITFADMTGDGLVDVFYRTSTWPSTFGTIQAYRGAPGGGWQPHTTFAFPAPPTSVDRDEWTLSDLDADGRAEILYTYAAGSYGPRRAGTRKLPNTATQVVAETLPDFISADPCSVLVDANGDGLPDLANVRGGITLRMNEGAFRFGPPVQATLIGDLAFSGVGCDPYGITQELTPDRGVRAADLDGDGRQDLIVFWNNDGRTTVQWFRSSELLITENDLLGTKVMYPVFKGVQLAMPVRLSDSLSGAAAAQLADLNGDGRLDFLQSNGTLQIDIQKGSVPDLLVSATNGIGLVEAVDYENLGTSAAYMRDCTSSAIQYPTRCVSSPGIAVVREKLDDGSGLRTVAEHAYTSRLVGALGEGDLGFARHVVTDVSVPSMPSKTATEVQRVRVGDLEGIGYYRGQGEPGRVTTTVFDPPTGVWHFTQETTTMSNKPAFDGKTQVVWPSRSFTLRGFGPSEDASSSSNSTTTWTEVITDVDGFGCPTSQIERRGAFTAATTTTTTTTKYTQDNPTAWLIGRPTFVTTTSESFNSHLPGLEVGVRSTAFRYDPVTGILIRTVREPAGETAIDTGDAALYLDTVITPNAFGQPRLVKQTRKLLDSQDLGSLSRTSELVYDLDSVHVVTTRAALEHTVNGVALETSRVVDPGRGIATRETDVNGLHTHHQYDRFGRHRRTEHPDGKAVDTSYAWDGVAKRLVVTTTGNDGSGATTYLDSLGRELLVEAKSFTGQVSKIITTYDGANRIATVTEPHFAGNTPNVRKLAYDALGRVISSCLHAADGVTAPICETTKYRPVFGGAPVVESRDASGRLSLVEHDAAGRIAKTTIHTSMTTGSCDVASNLASSAASTTFAYHPFDLLASSKDPAANLVSLTYDKLGRRTGLADPDTGTRTFKYDAFGELREERDATGRVTRTNYDPLGRPTLRKATPTDEDGDARWTYDTAAGLGKGKVATSANAAVTRGFAYSGPAGALDLSTISYHGVTHSLTRSFDTLGRVKDTTYPAALGRGAFTTRNVYNAQGYLSEIQSVGAGGATTSIWAGTLADAANRIKAQKVNAGKVTTRFTYHPMTFRVTGIQTRFLDATPSDASNDTIQSSEFMYCQNGNVQSRRDFLRNQLETFSYDDANRLISARVAGSLARTWSYDVLGNTTSTNEPGLSGCTWRYGEGTPGPHALTSIQCGTSTYPFVYDANGNMLQAPAIPAAIPARSVAFGAHKAAIISNGTTTFRLFHDAEGGRASKHQTLGGTARHEYFDGLFERRLNTDGTIDYVYLVSALGQTVAQHTWHWDGVTGTGDWRYPHDDVLGSPELTSNTNGTGAADNVAFDAWGKRRSSTWSSSTAPAAPASLKLGFTGHVHDDEFGVIDMGGRIYDPTLKRFLSADPFVQAPFYGPSWNRYSYVFNNPLRYVDPSGYRASLQTSNRLNGGIVTVTRPYEQGWGLLEGTFGIANTVLRQNWTTFTDGSGKQRTAQSASELRELVAAYGLSAPMASSGPQAWSARQAFAAADASSTEGFLADNSDIFAKEQQQLDDDIAQVQSDAYVLKRDVRSAKMNLERAQEALAETRTTRNIAMVGGVVGMLVSAALANPPAVYGVFSATEVSLATLALKEENQSRALSQQHDAARDAATDAERRIGRLSGRVDAVIRRGNGLAVGRDLWRTVHRIINQARDAQQQCANMSCQ